MGRLKRTSKIVLGVVITLIVVAGALYGLAYLTTSRSGIARSIIWMDADVFDYRRFPARTMEATDHPLVLNRGSESDPSLFDDAVPGGRARELLDADSNRGLHRDPRRRDHL